MRKIAVLTSGGDAPGMNAALRALTKLAAAQGIEVLGVELGYEGLMQGRFRKLVDECDGELRVVAELDAALAEGGTILGSARSKKFMQPEGRAEAVKQLNDAGVDGLVVVGGNGSLTGALKLYEEHDYPVVGIPASIDNDIGHTSFAIGVDTALNTIVESCDRISDTARAHRRAFIVEVMGRDSGYLAMASAVAAGADAALFKEQGRSEEEIVDQVEAIIRKGFAEGKHRVLIIKAEGVKIPCTRLSRELNERIEGDLVRATVLGHVVRGGRPSFQDRRIAGRLALQALWALEQGHFGNMAAWKPHFHGGFGTLDPSVQLFPINEVLEETARMLGGSSPRTKWRVAMLERLEGVVGL